MPYDYINGFELDFPMHITRITSNFIQGLFYEIMDNLTEGDLQDIVMIKSSYKQLTNSIYKYLE